MISLLASAHDTIQSERKWGVCEREGRERDRKGQRNERRGRDNIIERREKVIILIIILIKISYPTVCRYLIASIKSTTLPFYYILLLAWWVIS